MPQTPSNPLVGPSLMSRVIIRNSAPGRAFEIVILSGFQRPEKCGQTDEPKTKRQRHQDDHHFHAGPPFDIWRARSAFSITSIEEPDIAAAAIRGVTTPLMAIGTARTL